MSTALKVASLASGFTLLSYSALHTMRTPQQDFSKQALAMDHTTDASLPAAAAPKPKLPSNFVSFTIGKYEFKNAA